MTVTKNESRLRSELRSLCFQQVEAGIFIDREGALWNIDTAEDGSLLAFYAIDEDSGWERATEEDIFDANPFRLLGHRVTVESLTKTIMSANSNEDAALNIRFQMLNSGMTLEEARQFEESYITDCELHHKIGAGIYTDNHTDTSVYDTRGHRTLIYMNGKVSAITREQIERPLYPLSVVLPVRSLLSMLSVQQSAAAKAQSIYELSALGIE